MTPLEEQLEKLAQLWEKPFFDGSPDETGTLYAQRLRRALLPLEVTDESVTVTLSREEIEAIFEAMSPGYSHEGPMDQHLKAVYPKLRETRACLSAALTQPQTKWREAFCEKHNVFHCDECGGGAATEKCEECKGRGKYAVAEPGDMDCPSCGGSGQSPSSVADADLVRVGDFFGIPAFTHPDVKPGIVGIVSAGEVTAVIADREEPSPYAKAFREKFPVPEFPGIEKEDA